MFTQTYLGDLTMFTQYTQTYLGDLTMFTQTYLGELNHVHPDIFR